MGEPVMQDQAVGMANVIRVLSIDGGGIRGIIPARILVELEERTGRRLGELFDVVAGTSTGALIALGLVKPGGSGSPALAMQEILDFYVQHGHEIFPKIPLRTVIRHPRRSDAMAATYQRFGAVVMPRRFGNSRYRAVGLERVLEAFGDAKLSQAVTDVVIPAYDWKAGRALVFRSRAARDGEGPDASMRDVARGTTAAPTYFPPHRLMLDDGHEVVLIDGGVVANNPISAAYFEALHREAVEGRDLDVMVVSLGTGRPIEAIPTYQELWSRSWLSLGMGLLGVVMDGTSEIADELLGHIIRKKEPGSRFWRFQTELTGCNLAMDDASPANVQALLGLAERVIEERSDDLDEIARILVEGARITSVPRGAGTEQAPADRQQGAAEFPIDPPRVRV